MKLKYFEIYLIGTIRNHTG